jgi:hypothetical protein
MPSSGGFPLLPATLFSDFHTITFLIYTPGANKLFADPQGFF